MKARQYKADGSPCSLSVLAKGAAGLGLSTLAVGAVLYAAALGEQPSTNSVITEGLALLIWCYYDGIVGHLSWGLAAVEALLRLRLALAWAKLLFEALS